MTHPAGPPGDPGTGGGGSTGPGRPAADLLTRLAIYLCVGFVLLLWARYLGAFE